ncbi:SPFH domain-containing protein [Altererythrobacter sp. ZODW24]|uniref:SPFH domain-containing protein n=1 Tax=Altererythrobacter sp. ZODW24 TaxID=2185142 RepID=UPI000DF7F07B|nr:SPFH domain-containing protein [Altererythrobacter sp. ZODW24]
MNISTERPAKGQNGYVMLLVLLAVAVIGFLIVSNGIPADGSSKATKIMFVLSLIGSILTLLLVSAGFYMIQPNQAAVVTLFGAYAGTDRTEGLRWVWPWMMRKKVSARVNNIISERLKVNDLRGNPIEIASNVVWRVEDTAQATFDVDDYKEFVHVQIEAAIRTVGARYAYDDIEDDEITLRAHPEVVNKELREELNDRLDVAGIEVDEVGLTHLAYAPEIAGAMLRRQQAEAVIAARTKLVMGAVSMVEMALVKLGEDKIVELDDERKAAMVSNLMVVLCGDKEAHPVVNAGTLYQ